MIDNKITDQITKFSKKLQQNNTETVTDENETEILKERYISLRYLSIRSPEERQKSNDNMRLI